MAKVKIRINVKPPTLTQPKISAKLLSQLNLIMSQTEKSQTLSMIKSSVLNIFQFSYLFLKGLQIQIYKAKVPDKQPVIRHQAPKRSQNKTKFTMNRVFLINNMVKYYLETYFKLLLIPSTKTFNTLGTSSFLLRQEKNSVIRSKLICNVIRANNEMVEFKLLSVLQFAIYKIDAKVNSQKLEVKILINPEQMKYQYCLLAIFYKKKIDLEIRKNLSQQLQKIAGQFQYLIMIRNLQKKYEKIQQANPMITTTTNVCKLFKSNN
ncbi:unnamed protein product [Paramecium octaurelia]|uniref:Uncharacterized protein n=1 Tax=Paramecium octaurelia TaxID=43137 RepID=A0A8S1YNS5_PAROT|nr:unnamed protein product [Paramecium octaurelia]